MNLPADFLKTNKQSWDNKVACHLASDFYDVKGFQKGNTSLNSIELDLLGDVRNKKILHLQCHFGQDSISLARLGAKVTGVDFSEKAIQAANKLASNEDVNVSFICCDLYSLPEKLTDTFDIVFTSYGTITWLPDLTKWAEVISQFLKPNGKFVFVEFHPVVWMFDDDFKTIKYPYFNSGAIVETETGSYADKDAAIEQEYVTWNHSMGEVMNSLIKNNLEIKTLNEFKYSPYNCFKHTVEFLSKKYQIDHLKDKIPMVYAIKAIKKNI